MRRSTSLAIVLLATLLGGSAASNDLAPRVRGINRGARELLAEAKEHSTVVRTFIDALEATDIIVLVTLEPLPSLFPSGYLTFVSAAGGVRYLAVKINSNAHPQTRIAVLAHELQHALEVGAAPEVHDGPTLVLLYSQIGYTVGPGRWETDVARSAGERALHELNGGGAEPNPFGIRLSPTDDTRRRTGHGRKEK